MLSGLPINPVVEDLAREGQADQGVDPGLMVEALEEMAPITVTLRETLPL